VNLIHRHRTAPSVEIVKTVLSEVDRPSQEDLNEDDRVPFIVRVVGCGIGVDRTEVPHTSR